ncbi:hypothetical protein PWEIH_08576 [Listeria weihenstephanensis FSL R9-0317]|uniref:Uncharacterized protein n=1 Tax=Listeria weihenstephanensis TaxID=1006155 RepID=A0A1S7FQH3_9LIST|nr:pectate lyase-like adhesive domain-containing protein [Listeria weihenstephanensis]AQY49629.1 hypothetical protein UE46_00140 [Listeria weihenstephanensis]EUJ39074.1 hypothetical protein PWEIH_08576 [Listeria weihenstephanensis FSL R9-0317]
MNKNTVKLSLSVLTAAAVLVAPLQLSADGGVKSLSSITAQADTYTVNSFAELKSALEQKSTSDTIVLGADIKATANVSVTTNRAAVIEGNDYKLDMGAYMLNFTQGGMYYIKDLDISSTGSYGAFRSDVFANLTFDNITFTGKQLAYIPKGAINFDNTNTLETNSTLEIAKVNSLSFSAGSVFNATTKADAFLMAQANPQVTVDQNATVNITSAKKAFNLTGATGKFQTATGSSLTTDTVDVALYINGSPTFGANSNTELSQQATGTLGLIYASTGLNVEKDANFVLNGSVKSTQLIRTAKAAINFNDVSNVYLKSNNTKGNIFSLGSGSLVTFDAPQTLTLGKKTTDDIYTATNLRASLAGSGTNLSVQSFAGNNSIVSYDFKTMGSFKLTK